MSLIHSNSKNPCPVCGSSTKGCSWDNITQVFLCRGDNPSPEYQFLKIDKNGTFGIYKRVEDIKTFNSSSAEAQAKWQDQIAERNKEKEAQFKKLLTRKARNAKYQELSKELGLFSRHRKELESRGITEGASLGFRSIKKYQKIACDTEMLAGFQNGKYVGRTGMLCPTRDPLGNITGYQVKADKGDEKYVWLKSANASSHLRNGEMPINIADSGAKALGFCEGILKSTIASRLHQGTFIGAANVGATPLQIKEAIKVLKIDLIIVFADAGSVVNPNVVAAYTRLASIALELGKEVKVADWGQWFSKDKKDIDEIASLDEVEYKDFSFFQAVSKNHELYGKSDEFISQQLTSAISQSMFGSQENLRRRKVELLATTSDWQEFQGELPLRSEVSSVLNYTFQGSAKDIYREAIAKGYKYLLDSSNTGSGKTFTAANLDVFDLLPSSKSAKLIYASKSSRDVNNAKLENDFTLLPARHDGYDYHESKVSPNGNPILVESTKAKSDVASNCKWSSLFNQTRSKNIDLDICGACKFKFNCRKMVGEGFGFKKQVAHASASKKIRATVAGLSKNTVNSSSVLIIDEYAQSVPWVKTIEISKSNIQRELDRVQNLSLTGLESLGDTESEIYTVESEILLKLMKAMAFAGTSNKHRHGVNLHTLTKFLKLEDYAENLLEDMMRDYDVKVNQENDEYFENSDKRVLSSESVVEELLQPVWFSTLIKAVTRQELSSSVLVTSKGITLSLINRRTIDVINQAKTVIFQDATGSRHDLALRLGVSPDSILEVAQESSLASNVTVKQVLGLGQAGINRSDSCRERITAFKKLIKADYGDAIGFIEYKKYSEPGDLIHFSDSRGSNLFQTKEAIVSFGSPVSNLSALQSQFEVYTGRVIESIDDPEFQQYVANEIGVLVIQEIGRLRANRRLEQELEYWIVSDTNISFLSDLGYKLEKTHVMQFNPDLGSRHERTRAIILETLEHLENEQNQNIETVTQTQLSKSSGLSQSTISKVAVKFGGWKKFKQVLKYLIRGVDKPEGELTEEEKLDVAKTQTYLPYVMRLDLENSEVVANLGEHQWFHVLEKLPRSLVSSFLASLVSCLPSNLKHDFILSVQFKLNLT